MATPFIGIGAELQRGGTASLGSPVPVALVTQIGGPELQSAQIDITHLGSPQGYRQFMQGLKSPGTMSFTAQFDPNDATHDSTTGIIADMGSGVTRYWRNLLPVAGKNKVNFQAFMQQIGFSLNPDNPALMNCALQISGLPTWTV